MLLPARCSLRLCPSTLQGCRAHHRRDDPTVAASHRFPGSPTIRVDGVDIDPGFVDPGDYTPRCRLYQTSEGLRGLPEPAWIEAALRSAIDRRGSAPS